MTILASGDAAFARRAIYCKIVFTVFRIYAISLSLSSATGDAAKESIQ